jgi:hypothetical protein
MFFSYKIVHDVDLFSTRGLQTDCTYPKVDLFPKHFILFQILDVGIILESCYSKSCNIQHLMIQEAPLIRN